MPPVIDAEKCTRCGMCVEICPVQVFRQTDKKETPAAKFRRECWHCNACVLDCPVNAITLRMPLPYMLAHVEASALRPGGDGNV